MDDVIRLGFEIDANSALTSVDKVKNKVDEVGAALQTLQENSQTGIESYDDNISQRIQFAMENLDGLVQAREKIDKATTGFDRDIATDRFLKMAQSVEKSIQDVFNSVDLAKTLTSGFKDGLLDSFNVAMRSIQAPLSEGLNKFVVESMERDRGANRGETRLMSDNEIIQGFLRSQHYKNVIQNAPEAALPYMKADQMSKYLAPMMSVMLPNYLRKDASVARAPVTHIASVRDLFPEQFKNISLAPSISAQDRRKLSEQPSASEILSRQEKQDLADLILSDSYAADAAVRAGIIRKENGKMYMNPRVSRGHVNAMGGFATEETEAALRGEAKYGIVDLEKVDAQQLRNIERKRNQGTVHGVNQMRYMSDKFGWIQPDHYAPIEAFTGPGEYIGNIRHSPRMHSRAFAEFTLDMMDQGWQLNGRNPTIAGVVRHDVTKPKVVRTEDKEALRQEYDALMNTGAIPKNMTLSQFAGEITPDDWHTVTQRRSMAMDIIENARPGGQLRHNDFSDHAIYLKLAKELADPELYNEKNKDELDKWIGRYAERIEKGYTNNGEHYSFTRFNKSHAEFIKDADLKAIGEAELKRQDQIHGTSVLSDLAKGEAAEMDAQLIKAGQKVLHNGADLFRDFDAYKPFAKSLDVVNKLATDAESLSDYMGVQKNNLRVVVSDFSGIDPQTGEAYESMNGANILSGELSTKGFQGRAYSDKATFAPHNLAGLRRIYKDRIATEEDLAEGGKYFGRKDINVGDLVLAGAGLGGTELIVPENTSVIEDIANYKTFKQDYGEAYDKALEEYRTTGSREALQRLQQTVNADRTSAFQKYGVYAKTSFGDAMTSNRWISHQLVTAMNKAFNDPDVSAMFDQIYREELAATTDEQKMRDRLFGGDQDVDLTLEENRDTIRNYRNMIVDRYENAGDRMLPENVLKYRMASPWVINAINKAARKGRREEIIQGKMKSQGLTWEQAEAAITPDDEKEIENAVTKAQADFELQDTMVALLNSAAEDVGVFRYPATAGGNIKTVNAASRISYKPVKRNSEEQPRRLKSARRSLGDRLTHKEDAIFDALDAAAQKEGVNYSSADLLNASRLLRGLTSDQMRSMSDAELAALGLENSEKSETKFADYMKTISQNAARQYEGQERIDRIKTALHNESLRSGTGLSDRFLSSTASKLASLSDEQIRSLSLDDLKNIGIVRKSVQNSSVLPMMGAVADYMSPEAQRKTRIIESLNEYAKNNGLTMSGDFITQTADKLSKYTPDELKNLSNEDVKSLGRFNKSASIDQIRSFVNAAADDIQGRAITHNASRYAKNVRYIADLLGTDPDAIHFSPDSPFLRKMQTEDFDGDTNGTVNLSPEERKHRAQRRMIDSFSKDSPALGKVLNYLFTLPTEEYEKIKKTAGRNDAFQAQLKEQRTEANQSQEVYNGANPMDIARAMVFGQRTTALMGMANSITRRAWQHNMNEAVAQGLLDSEDDYDVVSTYQKEMNLYKHSKEEWDILKGGATWGEMKGWAYKALRQGAESTGNDNQDNLAWTKESQDYLNSKNIDSANLPSINIGADIDPLIRGFVHKQKTGEVLGVKDSKGNLVYNWDEIFNNLPEVQDPNSAVGRMTKRLREVRKGLLNYDYVALGDSLMDELNYNQQQAWTEISNKIENSPEYAGMSAREKANEKQRQFREAGGYVYENAKNFGPTLANILSDEGRAIQFEQARIATGGDDSRLVAESVFAPQNLDNFIKEREEKIKSAQNEQAALQAKKDEIQNKIDTIKAGQASQSQEAAENIQTTAQTEGVVQQKIAEATQTPSSSDAELEALNRQLADLQKQQEANEQIIQQTKKEIDATKDAAKEFKSFDYDKLKASEKYISLQERLGDFRRNTNASFFGNENRTRGIPYAKLYYNRGWFQAKALRDEILDFQKTDDYKKLGPTEQQNLIDFLEGKNSLYDLNAKDLGAKGVAYSQGNVTSMREMLNKSTGNYDSRASNIADRQRRLDESKGFRDLMLDLTQNPLLDDTTIAFLETQAGEMDTSIAQEENLIKQLNAIQKEQYEKEGFVAQKNVLSKILDTDLPEIQKVMRGTGLSAGDIRGLASMRPVQEMQFADQWNQAFGRRDFDQLVDEAYQIKQTAEQKREAQAKAEEAVQEAKTKTEQAVQDAQTNTEQTVHETRSAIEQTTPNFQNLIQEYKTAKDKSDALYSEIYDPLYEKYGYGPKEYDKIEEEAKRHVRYPELLQAEKAEKEAFDKKAKFIENSMVHPEKQENFRQVNENEEFFADFMTHLGPRQENYQQTEKDNEERIKREQAELEAQEERAKLLEKLERRPDYQNLVQEAKATSAKYDALNAELFDPILAKYGYGPQQYEKAEAELKQHERYPELLQADKTRKEAFDKKAKFIEDFMAHPEKYEEETAEKTLENAVDQKQAEHRRDTQMSTTSSQAAGLDEYIGGKTSKQAKQKVKQSQVESAVDQGYEDWIAAQNAEIYREAEKESLTKENSNRKTAEEANRAAIEEEVARKAAEAEEARKAEEERRVNEEAERKEQEKAAQKTAEEEARRAKEEETRRAAEEEAKKAEEEQRSKEEASRKAEEEMAKQAEEETVARKAEDERKAKEEAERKAQEEAARKTAEEEAKKAAEEETARRAAEEENRKIAEEEAARKASEEQEAKRIAEEEAARKAEEEKLAQKRAEEEAARNAEKERIAKEEAERGKQLAADVEAKKQNRVEAETKAQSVANQVAAQEEKIAKMSASAAPAMDQLSAMSYGGLTGEEARIAAEADYERYSAAKKQAQTDWDEMPSAYKQKREELSSSWFKADSAEEQALEESKQADLELRRAKSDQYDTDSKRQKIQDRIDELDDFFSRKDSMPPLTEMQEDYKAAAIEESRLYHQISELEYYERWQKAKERLPKLEKAVEEAASPKPGEIYNPTFTNGTRNISRDEVVARRLENAFKLPRERAQDISHFLLQKEANRSLSELTPAALTEMGMSENDAQKTVKGLGSLMRAEVKGHKLVQQKQLEDTKRYLYEMDGEERFKDIDTSVSIEELKKRRSAALEKERALGTDLSKLQTIEDRKAERADLETELDAVNKELQQKNDRVSKAQEESQKRDQAVANINTTKNQISSEIDRLDNEYKQARKDKQEEISHQDDRMADASRFMSQYDQQKELANQETKKQESSIAAEKEKLAQLYQEKEQADKTVQDAREAEKTSNEALRKHTEEIKAQEVQRARIGQEEQDVVAPGFIASKISSLRLGRKLSEETRVSAGELLAQNTGTLSDEEKAKLRNELLGVSGIGQKTAEELIANRGYLFGQQASVSGSRAGGILSSLITSIVGGGAPGGNQTGQAHEPTLSERITASGTRLQQALSHRMGLSPDASEAERQEAQTRLDNARAEYQALLDESRRQQAATTRTSNQPPEQQPSLPKTPEQTEQKPSEQVKQNEQRQDQVEQTQGQTLEAQLAAAKAERQQAVNHLAELEANVGGPSVLSERQAAEKRVEESYAREQNLAEQYARQLEAERQRREGAAGMQGLAQNGFADLVRNAGANFDVTALNDKLRGFYDSAMAAGFDPLEAFRESNFKQDALKFLPQDAYRNMQRNAQVIESQLTSSFGAMNNDARKQMVANGFIDESFIDKSDDNNWRIKQGAYAQYRKDAYDNDLQYRKDQAEINEMKAEARSQRQLDMMDRQAQDFGRQRAMMADNSMIGRNVNAYVSRKMALTRTRDDLAGQTETLQKERDLAARRVEDYEKQHKGADLSKDATYQALKSAQNLSEINLKVNTDQIEKANGQIRSLNVGMTTLRVVADTAAQSINRFAMRMGRQLFQKALQETKRFVKEFDTSMNTIQQITMKSDDQMKGVRKQTIDKALGLKTSVSNVASVESALYRQGLSDGEVSDRTDSIIKFATVTGTKVESATKIITTALQNNLVSSAQEAMDALVALGDSAATTAEEIAKGMQKAAASAKVAGVSYSELTAMLTVVTSKTQLGGAQAGTALQTVFSRMHKIGKNGIITDANGETTGTNDVALALASAGIPLFDEKDKTKFRNTTDVLRDLAKVWNDLNDLQKNNIINAMAGTRQANMFSTLMEGMSEDNGEEFERLLGLAENSEGITQSKYEIAMQSLNAAINELKSSWDQLIESMTVSGAASGVLGFITNILQGVTALSSKLGGIPTILALIGTALAAVAAKALIAQASIPLIGPFLALLGGIGVAVGGASLLGGIGNSMADKPTSSQEKSMAAQKSLSSYNSFATQRLAEIEEVREKAKELYDELNSPDYEIGSDAAKEGALKTYIQELIALMPELRSAAAGVTGEFEQWGAVLEASDAKYEETKKNMALVLAERGVGAAQAFYEEQSENAPSDTGYLADYVKPGTDGKFKGRFGYGLFDDVITNDVNDVYGEASRAIERGEVPELFTYNFNNENSEFEEMFGISREDFDNINQNGTVTERLNRYREMLRSFLAYDMYVQNPDVFGGKGRVRDEKEAFKYIAKNYDQIKYGKESADAVFNAWKQTDVGSQFLSWHYDKDKIATLDFAKFASDFKGNDFVLGDAYESMKTAMPAIDEQLGLQTLSGETYTEDYVKKLFGSDEYFGAAVKRYFGDNPNVVNWMTNEFLAENQGKTVKDLTPEIAKNFLVGLIKGEGDSATKLRKILQPTDYKYAIRDDTGELLVGLHDTDKEYVGNAVDQELEALDQRIAEEEKKENRTAKEDEELKALKARKDKLSKYKTDKLPSYDENTNRDVVVTSTGKYVNRTTGEVVSDVYGGMKTNPKSFGYADQYQAMLRYAREAQNDVGKFNESIGGTNFPFFEPFLESDATLAKMVNDLETGNGNTKMDDVVSYLENKVYGSTSGEAINKLFGQAYNVSGMRTNLARMKTSSTGNENMYAMVAEATKLPVEWVRKNWESARNAYETATEEAEASYMAAVRADIDKTFDTDQYAKKDEKTGKITGWDFTDEAIKAINNRYAGQGITVTADKDKGYVISRNNIDYDENGQYKTYKRQYTQAEIDRLGQKMMASGLDWNEAVDHFKQTGEMIDDDFTALMNSDYYKYLTMSSSQRQSAEGQILLRNINESRRTRRVSQREELGELGAGATDYYKAMLRGGDQAKAAYRQQQSTLFTRGQTLALLQNGTREEKAQAAMQTLGISADQYYATSDSEREYNTEAIAEVHRENEKTRALHAQMINEATTPTERAKRIEDAEGLGFTVTNAENAQATAILKNAPAVIRPYLTNILRQQGFDVDANGVVSRYNVKGGPEAKLIRNAEQSAAIRSGNTAERLGVFGGYRSQVMQYQNALWAVDNGNTTENRALISAILPDLSDKDIKEMMSDASEGGGRDQLKEAIKSKSNETWRTLATVLNQSDLGLNLNTEDMSGAKAEILKAAEGATGDVKDFLLFLADVVDSSTDGLSAQSANATFGDVISSNLEGTVERNNAMIKAKEYIDGTRPWEGISTDNTVKWGSLDSALLTMMSMRANGNETITNDMLNSAYSEAMMGRTSSDTRNNLMGTILASYGAPGVFNKNGTINPNADMDQVKGAFNKALMANDGSTEFITEYMGQYSDLQNMFANLAKGDVDAAREDLKKFNAEVVKGAASSSKYAKANKNIPEILSKIAQGGREAKTGYAMLAKNARDYQDVLTAVNKAQGKSGSQLNDATRNVLADWLGVDASEIKDWTADYLSEQLKDVPQEVQDQFAADMNAILDNSDVVLNSDNIHVRADGTIDTSELQAVCGEAYDEINAMILAMGGNWGQIKFDYDKNGHLIVISANAIANKNGKFSKGGKGGGGGGGGGGKSAADKLLEEQKHQQAEAEHEVKMLEIQEKHYDRTNQYDNYLSHLDREIAAQEKLQSVYAKNVQELKDMMGSTAKGSEDWYKLRDALYAAEEKLSEINNTIDEINGKRVQIVSEKQENQDKPQSHKMTMIQTLAARYMSAKEFENYYKTMQQQIAAAHEQISQNEAQIAEWEGMLTLYEENSDEWIEVRDKIWAMREENASLENQALEDMINMNQQKISQISEELQHSQAFDNHAVNMWSTYGGMYNANAQFADYRKALAEQNTGYENNIATYQVAIAGLRELLGTLDQSSDEWYSARDAIFEYEEAIASAKNSILENNQAIQESTVTEMTTDYDRMTGELEHEIKILQNQKQIYDNANDYEAYVEMMKKEKDATVDMVRSMQNSLAQMESTIGTIDENSEAWWNLHDKILSVREAISEAEVNLENFDRQIEQSKIEHLLEKFGQVDEMSQHQIKMIQFQETRYQNAGELTNYGTMLGIENDYQQRYADDLKDHIRLLKEERENVEAGSDVYFKLEQSIAKYEEQLESTNNTIEKNNRMIEQNQEKIRQTVMTVENTLDKEYRARIQKTRDMLAAEVNMQNTILDVIKARYNAEFNLEKNRINKLKESLNQEKSLINERLNARKNAVDQADQYEELAEYKRQLALLSADPTRTKEAKELQKKISDLEKSMAFDVASAEATAEGERIDDQMKAYDDYLTTAQEDLNMMLQDSEALMAAAQNDFGYNVTELMAGSWTDLLAWLQENNVNYRNATEELQTQMVNSWEDTWKKMWGIIDTYWDEISGLMDNSDDFLAYMQDSDTYAAASETGKQSLTYGWAESYRNMLNALKDDASYDHIHELEDTIVSKIDEAKDWTYKVQLDGAYKDLVGGFSLNDYMNYGYGHTPVDVSDIFWDDLYAGIGKIVKELDGIEYTVKSSGGSGGGSGGSGKQKQKYFIYGGSDGETIVGEVEAESYEEAFSKWQEENKKHDATYVSGDEGTKRIVKDTSSLLNSITAVQSVAASLQEGLKNMLGTKNAKGGLVDYTGLAWVDGSFSEPEAFLSAADTKNIQALTNALSYVSVPTYGVPNMGEFTSNTQNIGDVYVTINQASLESDADLDYVATQVGKKFTKQLSKQGFNLNTVSF